MEHPLTRRMTRTQLRRSTLLLSVFEGTDYESPNSHNDIWIHQRILLVTMQARFFAKTSLARLLVITVSAKHFKSGALPVKWGLFEVTLHICMSSLAVQIHKSTPTDPFALLPCAYDDDDGS